MHASPEQLIALRDGDPVDAAAQMHARECPQCAAELATLNRLRTGFASLPGFAVPEGAWNTIRERLEQPDAQTRFRRQGLRIASVAMVASVVGALAFMLIRTPQSAAPVTAATSGASPAALSRLVRQSHYLEDAVMSLNADTDHMAITAGTAATVAALEDRIALVDYEINHAATSPESENRLPQLWQQRVNLLQSLAAVRYAQVANSNI